MSWGAIDHPDNPGDYEAIFLARMQPEDFMVSGLLTEKQGMFYMVLSYKDEFGKRKEKWKTTGLPVKGNKKRAESILKDAWQEFEPPTPFTPKISENILFSDFMLEWLEVVKTNMR